MSRNMCIALAAIVLTAFTFDVAYAQRGGGRGGGGGGGAGGGGRGFSGGGGGGAQFRGNPGGFQGGVPRGGGIQVNPSGNIRINPGFSQPSVSGNLRSGGGVTVQRPVVPNVNRAPSMTLRNNLNAALGGNTNLSAAQRAGNLSATSQAMIGRNSVQHPQNWNNWGQNWTQYGVRPAYRNWGYQGAWSGFYGPSWYSGYSPSRFGYNNQLGYGGYGSGFGLGYGGLGLGYGGYGLGGYGYGRGLFGLGGLGYGLTPWLLNSAGYRWGYNSFYNPYVGNVGGFPYNYAQPVYVTTYVDDGQSLDDSIAQALAAARESFRAGDYERALTWIDNVIKASPSDTPAHEFRALTLFALGRYEEAAATLNALLAVAPGWNWATMAGFYSDVNEYTRQLRTLEAFAGQNRDSGAAHFLLAYHYLVTGHPQNAQRELSQVVELEPRDMVARQLLQGLEKDDGGPPPAPSNPVPAPPPQERHPFSEAMTELEGHFIAERKDGERFELTLNKSGDFSWKAAGEEGHEIDGRFDLEGNVIVLNGGRGDTLAATVTAEGPDQFHFKLLGAPPGDPGLEFHRASR